MLVLRNNYNLSLANLAVNTGFIQVKFFLIDIDSSSQGTGHDTFPSSSSSKNQKNQMDLDKLYMS